MSSINSDSPRRASKAGSSSAMSKQAARDKRDAERAKKDRDLAMIAVMQAPAIQARAAGRDREENMCSQLATRIVGGVSMFMALLMFVVATVITAQNCCGDHTKYNEGEFKRECRTEAEAAADSLPGADENANNTNAQSCYKRNVNTIIVLSFAVYLLIVGITIIIAGECLYATDASEARQETRMEDLAGKLKAQEIERRLQEREDRRWDREERREIRDENREQRRLSQLEATRNKQQAENARGSRYAGAAPYHRHSVGSPATVNTTPVFTQSGPALVQSQRRGTIGFNGGQQQPQIVVRQVPAQGQSYAYGQSTNPRYVQSQNAGNIQVRVVPQQQV